MKSVYGAIIGLLLGCIIIMGFYMVQHECPQPEPPEPEYTVGEPTLSEPPTVEPVEPEPTEPAPVRYELTDTERQLVCEVVMAEAGNQGFTGASLVASCILNSCEMDGIRPAEVIGKYQYTTNRVEPTQVIQDAVNAVFNDGYSYIDEPIKYFYAPAHTVSKWHESQRFVLEYKDHRFFAEVLHE